MNLRPGLVVTTLALLLALAAGVALLAVAADSRRHPLDGSWTGEFRLNTADTQRPVTTPRTTRGVVTLGRDGASPDWARPFWRTSYGGSYVAGFDELVGHPLPDAAPPAVALRIGRDSVELFLGPPCCDAGGLRGGGRIDGDTVITGRWQLDLDGETAAGRFRLVRDRQGG